MTDRRKVRDLTDGLLDTQGGRELLRSWTFGFFASGSLFTVFKLEKVKKCVFSRVCVQVR